jgi:hypothetical protein
MGKRWLEIGCLLVALVLLFAQYASAVPNDDDLAVLNRLGFFAQPPLEPELSSDETAVFNAALPLVIFADPNPSPEPLRIPPPIDLLTAPESATATFTITYIPNGGSDHWGQPCITFPVSAQAAFNAAASIWANLVQSTVPITINACWANLSSSSILGYSGGGTLYRDFTGAPVANTWYTSSLANALHGSALSTSNFDMHITYNNGFAWYYGTDGLPPAGQYDLMSVVLHEMAHGLNFAGSMGYSSGSGSWGYTTGYPNIYDRFMRDNSGNQLIDTGVYSNPSAALGSALTSNNIWFHGSNAMAANGSVRVKMYAPSTWAPGSSYSHLDYTTFQGTANRLMVYAISSGVSTHDPGPVAKGLLKDVGWSISSGQAWTSLPGKTPSPPALAWNPGSSKLQIVVRAGDNSLWTATFNSSGVFNNDWASIPGRSVSPPALAWNTTANKMQMVVRASDNSIWVSSFSSTGTFNNDWASIPGMAASPPGLAWNAAASKMQLVVRASDNSIWVSSFNSAGTFSNNWASIPGRTVSPPALAWNAAANKMQMVVRASDNSIWVSSFNSAGTFNNDWISISGRTVEPPALAYDSSASEVGMVVRASDNSIWFATFNSTGAFNNDWVNISGATPSAPAMAYLPSVGNFEIVIRASDDSLWRLLY